MKALSLAKLPELFSLVASKEALYIPADDGAGSARFTRYTEGLEMTDKLNTVRSAKDYVHGALAAGLDLGRGSGPLDHMWEY